MREHAAALTAAFRRGEALPAVTASPPGDSAVLAAAAVNGLIDEIVFGEAPALALEAVAAIELHWRILDRLTGLIALDEERPGGPRLRGFQELLVEQTNRRRAAAAEDPRLIELPNWNAHTERIVADQKRAWLDYGRRLANDSSATFNAQALPQ